MSAPDDIAQPQPQPQQQQQPVSTPVQPITTSSKPSPPPLDTAHAETKPESGVLEHDRPRSPERPAVSPITPTAIPASSDPLDQPPPLNINATSDSTSKQQQQPQQQDQTPRFIPQPPPKPFSDESSTDAAALRAAISILQIQKEKSKRDIQTLQDLKDAAGKDPDGFLRHLVDGKLKQDQGQVKDPLRATFEHDVASDEDDDGDDTDKPDSKFPKIPNPQNVFRCPPINWSKYGILGEPLDRMHDEQRRRPSPGELTRSGDHVVAAPYNPFRDTFDPQHPMQTRRGSTKPP